MEFDVKEAAIQERMNAESEWDAINHPSDPTLSEEEVRQNVMGMLSIDALCEGLKAPDTFWYGQLVEWRAINLSNQRCGKPRFRDLIEAACDICFELRAPECFEEGIRNFFATMESAS